MPCLPSLDTACAVCVANTTRVCQLNKTHCVKASCLSKLINPVGVKVKKQNENHAGLLKFHLWYSDGSHWLHLNPQLTEES